MKSTFWMTAQETEDEINRRNVIVDRIRAKTPPDYLMAARDLARKHLTGAAGDLLPANMNAKTVALISDNISRFQMHVSAAHKDIYGY